MKISFVKIGLLVLLSSFKLTSQAQQYLIKHDLTNARTQYYRIENRDTSRVRNISLKRNGRIILQVDNFNPFYWNAKVTSYKNPVDEEAGFAQAFNPISVLAGGLGDIMGSLPFLDIPKSRGANDGSNSSRFLNTAGSFADHYAKLQELNEKSDKLQVLELQLKELKYDFTRSEKEIKGEAELAVRKVLGTNRLDLFNAIEIGKDYSRQLVNALEGAAASNQQLQQQLSTVNPNEDYEGHTLKEIAQLTASHTAKLSQLKNLQEKNPNFLVSQVAEVAALYKDIISANFNFKYAITSEPDLSDIKLELFPRQSDSKDTIVQYFQLSGKRNIKIRNSLGIAFSYFTENNTNYFIGGDSVIRSSGKDLFNPLISTMIHFYSGKTSGVKLGGALGFGIPMQGEKKDINFLLGMSAGVGQNEPILISAGISGAKVNKLTNGHRLGAKTTERDAAKLTASSYDIGGFLSITFNLSSLNLGKK